METVANLPTRLERASAENLSESALKWWPGAESNHRHADFQAVRGWHGIVNSMPCNARHSRFQLRDVAISVTIVTPRLRLWPYGYRCPRQTGLSRRLPEVGPEAQKRPPLTIAQGSRKRSFADLPEQPDKDRASPISASGRGGPRTERLSRRGHSRVADGSR
jgi:hypothetical protein